MNREFTPTADDLWPQPLRAAVSEEDAHARDRLWQQRRRLAAEIELTEASVMHWNLSHPGEEPMPYDPQLSAIARRIRELEARGQ